MDKTNTDINNINTEEIWVDVETVARLKKISKIAVRLSLNNDKYECKSEKCRGGYLYKIKLSTLETELRDFIEYIKNHLGG